MRKPYVTLVLPALLSLVLIGCNAAEKPMEQTPNPNQVPNRVEEDMPGTQNNNTNADDNLNLNNQTDSNEISARANQIAAAVAQLNEVEKATVLITEKTALVGVTLPSSVQGELTTDVKKRVEEVVKQTDREITMVAVSADPDIVSKIQDIWNDTKNGRPIQGFTTEIEDLIRRIVPNA